MIPFSTTAPSTRRNGKPPSCEPCRAQKVRCDHATPVCGRCYLRGVAEDCTYHPAPLTKPTGAQGSSSSSSHSLSREPGAPLIFTSYRAVFDENQPLLQSLLLDSPLISSDDPVVPSAEDLFTGSEILQFFRSSSVCIQLVDSYYQKSFVPILPRILVQSICSSAHIILDALSATDPLSQEIQDLTSRICSNSWQKLTKSEQITMETYCSHFTGSNMRWESFGIIFAVAGVCLMSLGDSDPLLLDNGGNPRAKHMLVYQLIDACDKCAGLCIRSQTSSEVSVAFLCNNIQFLTMVFGDASRRAWFRLTELSGLVYCEGLHLDQNTYPIFLRHWRRRIFAAAFFIDTALSTFIGRPPLINWRYCDMTPPQDVGDDDLFSMDDTPGKPQWNEHGWQLPDRINPCSFIRLRFMISALRAEILEVCMGMTTSDMEQRARDLLRKVVSFQGKVPSYMRLDTITESQNTQGGMTSHDRMVLLVQLDMKYNSFLLQRSILKRTNTGLRSLITTCEEILSALSRICKESENISSLKNDYSWAIIFYGLPCAGLIAFEMVKDPPQHDLSQLIPLLSVFASTLRWIAPFNYGNYKICRQAEFQLGRILDAVIERQYSFENLPPSLVPPGVGDVSAVQFLPPDSIDFLDPAILSNQIH